MLKVEFIPHSENRFQETKTLENVVQNIDKSGNSILHVTSDEKGYTIIYFEKERKSLNE